MYAQSKHEVGNVDGLSGELPSDQPAFTTFLDYYSPATNRHAKLYEDPNSSSEDGCSQPSAIDIELTLIDLELKTHGPTFLEALGLHY